jgi:transcription antitermination factor NusG
MVMANKYEFSKGETVRIKVGVFRAFIGKVSEIHKRKSTLTVIVEVSGKPHLIELSFLEVEKLDRETSTH